MEPKDEDLMLDFQAGNQRAIEMLFNRYKSRILNFCLRILGNRAEAEDVTGEVILVLFAKSYHFDSKAKFSTWLYTIARNSCISRIRKRKNLVSMWFNSKEKGDEVAWDIPDTNASTHEMVEKKEMAHHVRGAIAKLPHEQKEAIILREYDQMDYEQISKVMGCSLEKVKILIFRARENLRGELASFLKEGQNG